MIFFHFLTEFCYLQYFISFLHKNLQCEGKLRQYVQWCLDNCKNTKASSRQYPPSTVEIAVSMPLYFNYIILLFLLAYLFMLKNFSCSFLNFLLKFSKNLIHPLVHSQSKQIKKLSENGSVEFWEESACK